MKKLWKRREREEEEREETQVSSSGSFIHILNTYTNVDTHPSSFLSFYSLFANRMLKLKKKKVCRERKKYGEKEKNRVGLNHRRATDFTLRNFRVFFSIDHKSLLFAPRRKSASLTIFFFFFLSFFSDPSLSLFKSCLLFLISWFYSILCEL